MASFNSCLDWPYNSQSSKERKMKISCFLRCAATGARHLVKNSVVERLKSKTLYWKWSEQRTKLRYLHWDNFTGIWK